MVEERRVDDDAEQDEDEDPAIDEAAERAIC